MLRDPELYTHYNTSIIQLHRLFSNVSIHFNEETKTRVSQTKRPTVLSL